MGDDETNLEPKEPAPLFHFAHFINNSQTIRRPISACPKARTQRKARAAIITATPTSTRRPEETSSAGK
jgi:hypothetical protein